MLLPFAMAQALDFLYAIPLIAATSFVYAGSRHEQMRVIIPAGIRISLWITGFLAAVFVLMTVIF